MIGVIASHELQVYRRSAFAWVAAAALQLILGWLFLSATEQYTLLQNTAAHTPGSSLTNYLVVHFVAPASVVMMLATPLLCMNLIAAEKHSGRFALFCSSPVTASEVILGKFIAALTFQFAILCLSALLVSSLKLFVPLDLGHLLSAYLGLTLFAGFATSLTLLFSSLTRLPPLAGFVSFTCLLLTWMISGTGNPGFLAQLSPSVRINSFMQGIFNSADFMYFICASAVLLSLCCWRASTENQYPEVKS